jgi:hypothetical protein
MSANGYSRGVGRARLEFRGCSRISQQPASNITGCTFYTTMIKLQKLNEVDETLIQNP